ncbi:TlpA family protein disulfide reductase [Candidatus Poribacteria bacterium]|nr:TlpA family protein disulfide reductase [Candidatus Poribacteria bacterium]
MYKKNTWILSLFLVFLACMSLVLWRANNKVNTETNSLRSRLEAISKDENVSAVIPIGDQAQFFELPSTSGDIRSLASESKLILLIYFKPTDCSLCLIESLLWRELDENYTDDELSIFAVTEENINQRDIVTFANARQLKFPFLFDVGNKVKKAYGISYTPVRILIDQSKRIVDAARCTHSQIEHQLLKEKLNTLLGN